MMKLAHGQRGYSMLGLLIGVVIVLILAGSYGRPVNTAKGRVPYAQYQIDRTREVVSLLNMRTMEGTFFSKFMDMTPPFLEIRRFFAEQQGSVDGGRYFRTPDQVISITTQVTPPTFAERVGYPLSR